MTTCMNTTTNKIRLLRRTQGLTQEDLAARSGCGLATIQRAESGRRLSAATISSIAAALDVSANELAPSCPETFEPYLPLEPIARGRALVATLLSAGRVDFGFCELDSIEDAHTIERFQSFCEAIAAIEGPLMPTALVARELDANGELSILAERGFRVGAAPFEITAYDVDDEGGTGIAMLFGQWDEHCAAIRVGRTAEDVSRAHVLAGLGKWEMVKGDAVVHSKSSEPPTEWADLFGAPQADGEA